MVSSTNIASTEVAPGTVPTGRGFIREETLYTTPGSPALSGWRFGSAVVYGSLLTLSLFAFSYLLMLACHVGVAAGGIISLGWGAAIWIFITGCIAYYFGGMLSNCLSPPVYGGYAKGAAVWALSIPLAMVILAIVAGGAGIFTGLNTPTVTNMTNNVAVHQGVNFGVLWTAVLTLIAGLVCSLLGSWSMVRADVSGVTENRIAS